MTVSLAALRHAGILLPLLCLLDCMYALDLAMEKTRPSVELVLASKLQNEVIAYTEHAVLFGLHVPTHAGYPPNELVDSLSKHARQHASCRPLLAALA